MEKKEFTTLNEKQKIMAFNQLKDDYSVLFEKYYEQPLLKFQKNVDKALNKMVIPKFFVEKYGRKFYMNVYEDKIVLIPMKKGE